MLYRLHCPTLNKVFLLLLLLTLTSYHAEKLKMGEFFNCKLNLTLQSKVNQPSKTIGSLTNVFCTSGPNLVILV